MLKGIKFTQKKPELQTDVSLLLENDKKYVAQS